MGGPMLLKRGDLLARGPTPEEQSEVQYSCAGFVLGIPASSTKYGLDLGWDSVTI
jgi:hypothetical protein